MPDLPAHREIAGDLANLSATRRRTRMAPRGRLDVATGTPASGRNASAGSRHPQPDQPA